MNEQRRNALIAGLGLAAAPVLPRAEAARDTNRTVAEEYWADKQGVKLWVYRKRLFEGKPRAQLFLVHGSSYSAKTMYDLQVPGRSDYSMMDHFARLGYDVWTMDHEGYGHSDRTGGAAEEVELAAPGLVRDDRARGPEILDAALDVGIAGGARGLAIALVVHGPHVVAQAREVIHHRVFALAGRLQIVG